MTPLHSWNEYYSAKNIQSQLVEKDSFFAISKRDYAELEEIAGRIYNWEKTNRLNFEPTSRFPEDNQPPL